ncbi:N-acetylglucosamine kinase [Roseobacter denitrificans]|uniref:Putative N-acetylglucosamine kinase n=1 Tax=Roseobacter denitrificans (strain ATCC 33942 / OCh 114) TaxID=375451 RepID=Q169J3_ROSDO|nr:BadF/BadG/BcrA/BcrD ATPase family protein [Roseobacter denitrificans]ABG31350.1 putative N-acetylglucosamine kinase [Roseobacter denitrificans OCh 114]AVL54374.1 N-acetylglucosamine kinase [Roseobacter denitrificans]SFF99871.1 glucosamine kinase [Roseobacter denitrificans OCh 114]
MKLSPKSYLLGVDGGGTGCRVAISDTCGRRIGGASGGPANFATDPDSALRNILTALDAAASDAGLASGWSEACVAHVGLAGIMEPSDAERVESALPFTQITVSDDRETSVAGALGPQDGVLMAIGTGTIVAAQSQGSTRYFGGWGMALADQASGGWLGQRALRQTVLALDGLQAHSAMTKNLLDLFDNDPNQIVQFSKHAEPGDYAGFAPMIIDAARMQDDNAQALMQRGAAYLNACIKAADLAETAALCLSGGVGPHYADYLDPRCQNRLQAPKGSALDGALMLAHQALHQGTGAR